MERLFSPTFLLNQQESQQQDGRDKHQQQWPHWASLLSTFIVIIIRVGTLLVINKHSQQISSYNPSFVWSTFTLFQKVFKNELCLWKLCFCGSRLQKFSFNVVKIVLYPFYPNKPNIKESLVKPVLAPNQTFAKFQILEKQFKQNLF